MAERLELVASLKENISTGAKKAGKALESIRPSHGMAAAQKWMETFRKGSDQTVAALRPVTGMMNSVGVGGLAASLSIGEMVKQFKELADSTLTLKEISRQSRITEDDLRRLRYAGERFHLNPDAVNSAVNSWSSQMVGFRMHTSKFYNELALMNADVAKRIASDSPIDGLKKTLDYISRIKDPQVRKMWAEDAGLGDMLPMLNRGPDGLASIFADAARAVTPMSQEMKDAAERFNKATTNFNQTWDNFKNDIGPSVLDPLSHSLDRLDETLKWAAKNPNDAVAGAAIIAGSFAGFWARARIMRGSAIAGGGGAMGRAAGEMGAAASQQVKATTTFAEAVAEFRAAVLQMRVGGGVPGGPVEPTKPGVPEPIENAPKGFLGKGGWKGVGGSVMEGVFGAMIYQAGEQAMDAVLGWTPKDQKTLDNATSPSKVWQDVREQWFGGGGRPSGSTLNTDGNALHRNDEMPVSSLPAHELFKTVRDGSKDGIVQGLREMAQQAALSGISLPGVGPGDGGGGRRGGGAGMPNLRYGRSAGGAFRHGPGAQGGDSNGAFNPQAPTSPGTYRPQYNLSNADLDDRVVNTIAGEATSKPDSIDAVINNMLNRVGSKGWGPSSNLLQVARAPGQYAGYRKADARLAERIRDRIRAISSGGVPDNTNGSNAYRAAWYHGKWYQQHAADGRVVGGNRFAYEPWAKNGPFAPYPSSKAEANSFAAHAKALNGTAPQAHATGGPIRGPGGPRSDSIFAMLSNGEFVVNARDAARHAGLLHAINAGGLPGFADGGLIDAARGRRSSWLNFFRRPLGAGGMGASRAVALGATAMMNGESGWGLNPNTYGWDVNGPSGGTAQWHDVTTGRGAGKLHRLSDLMAFAMHQHADWHDVGVQQAWWKHEATGPLSSAWAAMRRARSAAGALSAGVHKFEVPAQANLEVLRRMPNILRLARENGGASRSEIGPVSIDIRHHPHTGKPIMSAKAGRGVRLGIRTAPTMRPT